MKKIKFSLLLVMSFLTITSCVEDDVFTASEGPYVVGFNSATPSYIYTENDVDPVNIFEAINLIGGENGTESDTNIVIEYSVNPASTAIAGTEYTINNTGNTLTVLAGENFVKLPITVYPTVLPGNTPKTIIVDLIQVSSGNGVIATSKKSVTITIAKCESDLAGTYDLTVTRLDNNTSVNFPNEVITQLEIGRYVTTTTGNYPVGSFTSAGAPRDGFVFNDVCQSIVIEEQNLGDFYTNLVFGNETDGTQGNVELDPETGEVVSITMYYIITFTNQTVLRPFKAVYTKI